MVCTNDMALDNLESERILSKISDHKTVLEIGCGNGLLYQKLRKAYNLEKYIGIDFVRELLDICKESKLHPNDEFQQLDMTAINNQSFNSKFDFIISKRAIQNVLDMDAQLQVIDNFGQYLEKDGLMILLESSKTAQDRINLSRKKFGLKKINPPFHNLFFNDDIIKKHRFRNVTLQKIDPFASDFYFITRIIYARFAHEFLGEDLSYDHPLQKIALSMDNIYATKDFSQIQCYTFKRN